jgi:glycosyltransferase involved in cell wall biosynthesis
MQPRLRTSPAGGAHARRATSYVGLHFDAFEAGSVWLREAATLTLPVLANVSALIIRGRTLPHPEVRGVESGAPVLGVAINGEPAGRTLPAFGEWELRLPVTPGEPVRLDFALHGNGLTNTLAWLGRILPVPAWQRFRAQNRNRQLRICTLAADDGEVLVDFSRRDAPFRREFFRRHARLGLNIVGFLTADLGVGESARCMVRAADAAGIASALVPLKLNCKNRQGDPTFAARLGEDAPHQVNVVHIDPPAARDLDHHHGPALRSGKYNIGYFAWELPEFPDDWIPSFDYFDEIWCPSDFTARAIAIKSPVPVLTMPHSIAFPAPTAPVNELRRRFGLPEGRFLFLTLFDLNSYAARKNPRAAIEAFRRSGLAGRGAALVLKVQNVAGNEADFAALRDAVRDLPETVLLTETLPRADVYALEAACDAFVSLHRSEGFGLAVAECMLLGKPVISTDWSATAEFVHAGNGCPVRAPLVTLDRSHGPYSKGSTWADPDPDHAAEHMRALFTDRTLAARLGAAAQATIRTQYSPAAIGARYRQRLEQIASF